MHWVESFYRWGLHALYRFGNDDFGKEALDEVQFMEDHRRDIVIIFAGWHERWRLLAGQFQGLQSRIPTTFWFWRLQPRWDRGDRSVRIAQARLPSQWRPYGEIVKGIICAIDHSNGRWGSPQWKTLAPSINPVTREGSTDYNSIFGSRFGSLERE